MYAQEPIVLYINILYINIDHARAHLGRVTYDGNARSQCNDAKKADGGIRVYNASRHNLFAVTHSVTWCPIEEYGINYMNLRRRLLVRCPESICMSLGALNSYA